MSTPHTLVHQLANWAATIPDSPAVHGKQGAMWVTHSWSEYYAAVREVAAGLIDLGVKPTDCVAIVGVNRPEWVFCQFGIMACRAIPAPIYTTLIDDQLAYIVQHSRSKVAICDGLEQYEKYRRCKEAGTIEIEHIVTMDDLGIEADDVMTLAALRERGVAAGFTELDARLEALTDDETALLIYTSGTTGVPKAVQLNHGGMIALSEALMERAPVLSTRAREYVSVSYLPLCHVAEQLFTNWLHMSCGGQVYFCPDLKQLKDYLAYVRPTVFLAVPRVWEKFQAALEARFAEASGLKGALLGWARKTELAGFKEEVARDAEYLPLTRKIARKLVISKVQAQLGMDRLMVAGSGAAPISVGTLEFFASIGLVINEAYGMSETSALVTCPYTGRPRFGSVGKALQCCELRIADDGEILAKGRNMTVGYLHDAEKTAELIDEEGWLHTGDLGSFDADGYLKITGRKKDLIITAGGKNVAPAEMESYMQMIPGVAQAVVVGDAQPYLAALVTLDPEALPELRARLGLKGETMADVARDEQLKNWLQEQVESTCNAKVARYQTIKKIDVLPVEFTVDGGELTPTMKVRRNIVSEKYADNIAALYA